MSRSKMKSITIRLPEEVVCTLKAEALMNMIYAGKYQQLTQDILKSWVAESPAPKKYIEQKTKKEVMP